MHRVGIHPGVDSALTRSLDFIFDCWISVQFRDGYQGQKGEQELVQLGYMTVRENECLAIIRIDPCIPVTWKSYQIDYRYRSTIYHILVQNSRPLGFCGTGSRVRSVVVDGIDQADKNIHLADDREGHQVVVDLGD